MTVVWFLPCPPGVVDKSELDESSEHKSSAASHPDVDSLHQKSMLYIYCKFVILLDCIMYMYVYEFLQ